MAIESETSHITNRINQDKNCSKTEWMNKNQPTYLKMSIGLPCCPNYSSCPHEF